MTCGAFEPGFRRGGPIKSAAHIVDTVSESVNLRLIVSDRDAGDDKPYPGLSGKWVARRRSRVFYHNHRSWKHWQKLFFDLGKTEFDLLYVNSFLETVFTLVPILAARVGIIRAKRILVAPRGELAPGALSLKTLKKVVYIKVFGLLLRRMKVVWHAATEMEANHIRGIFPWAEVYVNTDQTELPEEPLEPPLSQVAHLRLVFISRISRAKNLEALLEALSRVQLRVDLDIYGPICDSSYWLQCQRIMQGLPGHVSAKYIGELSPEKVRRTFAGYDAFLLPTRGENFGHVIAESLSASCPVICPNTTPWTDVLKAGGGFVLESSLPDAIAEVIEALASADVAERLRHRVRAGAVYRQWRKTTATTNIIDTVRDDTEGGSKPPINGAVGTDL